MLVLAHVSDYTPVASGAGWVVWSRRTPAGFILDARDPDGAIHALSAPPRPVAFDASPGLDARGRLVVVYSRCRREPGLGLDEVAYARGTGCRLWAFRPATGRERPVSPAPSARESFYRPAMSAATLFYAHRRGTRVTVESRRLAGRVVRTFPLGLSTPRHRAPVVLGTATDGHRFAVSVSDDDRRNELDLYAGGRRVTLDRGFYGEGCMAEPESPSFDQADGALHWLRIADCRTTASFVRGPPHRRGHAVDAGALARGRGVEYALSARPEGFDVVVSRPRDRPFVDHERPPAPEGGG